MQKKLTKTQTSILAAALLPMVAVGIAGGIGTYSNISNAYGSGTAIGALAAGEGATAVLALVLLITTMLGQSAPAIIRIGLWALPATAAVMGATAATQGLGQTIVYAATPMAITAGAEGLAFLVRRIVVHQEGRDIEAQARAAAVVRDLAYHQARATAHPSARARKRSVRRSWRLARKVGNGDIALGVQLLDVQRTRLVAGADTALAAMFQPGMVPAAVESPTRPEDAGSLVIERAEMPADQSGTAGTALTEATEGQQLGNRLAGTDFARAGTVAPQVSAPVMPALARIAPAPEAGNEERMPEPVAPAAALGKPDTPLGKPLGQEVGKPSTPELPAEGKPLGKPRSVSIAQAVREVKSLGITDDDRITAKVPALLGREVKETSIRREIRRQRPAAAPTTQAGTGAYL